MPGPGIHASGHLRVGLALSGGMAKSVTHIGVMRALADAGIQFDIICGTSGGSLVAAAFAGGVSIPDMETIARELGWSRLASLRLSRLGLASSYRIEKLMVELVGERMLDETNPPCGVTVTDLTTGDGRLLHTGSIARAVRASCSIPQIYRPVEIDGRYYVDGALSEYLPAQSTRALGAGFVVGIHFTSETQEAAQPANILQLSMQLTQLVARQNLPLSLQATDYVIVPPVSHLSAFDFGSANEMLDLGYHAGAEHADALKQALLKKQQRLHEAVDWALSEA